MGGCHYGGDGGARGAARRLGQAARLASLTKGARVEQVETASNRRARRSLWWVGLLLVVTTVFGRAWDGWWHVTRTYDGFWSPPHVFVYVMTTLIGALVARLALVPELRRAFGPGFAVRGVPFAVPGPLFLLGGGIVSLGVAGMVLDNIWHSAFGLNETAWSLPHAMIGSSLALTACGYVACSHALRGGLGRWGALFHGVVLVAVLQVILGPVGQYNTVATVEALAQIPALAAQPAAQERFFLCISNNLTRSNPALMLLGALWLGISLATVRGLSGRAWPAVAASAIWTLIAMTSDMRGARWLDQFGSVSAQPASWLPLPLLPAALAWWLATALGRGERAAWAVAGLVFGAVAAAVWRMPPAAWLLLPLAAALAVAGARLGGAMAATIRAPSRGRSWALALTLAAAFPAITGSVDLILRLRG